MVETLARFYFTWLGLLDARRMPKVGCDNDMSCDNELSWDNGKCINDPCCETDCDDSISVRIL